MWCVLHSCVHTCTKMWSLFGLVLLKSTNNHLLVQHIINTYEYETSVLVERSTCTLFGMHLMSCTCAHVLHVCHVCITYYLYICTYYMYVCTHIYILCTHSCTYIYIYTCTCCKYRCVYLESCPSN